LASSSRKRFSDDEYRNRWFVLGGVNAAHRASENSSFNAALHVGYERYFLRLQMHPDVNLQLRRRLGGRLESSFRLHPLAMTRLGLDGSYRDVDANGTRTSLVQTAAFFEQDFTPFRELSASAGARVEAARVNHSDFGHEHAFKADGAWWGKINALPARATNLFVRGGRTLRFPALGEYPHRSLRPEALTGVDFGIRQGLFDERIRFSLTAYALRLEREIAPDTSGEYVNVAESSSFRGLEVRAETRLSDVWSSYATYTLSSARDQRSRSIAYGPPRHMASAGLLAHSERSSARFSARYLGNKSGILRHMGDAGRVSDSLVFDVFAERQLTQNVSLFVQGNNLLDVTYETFQGRPMFARSVFVGATLSEVLEEPKHEK
jgi:outer membrane receptor protein involved in Fe transport